MNEKMREMVDRGNLSEASYKELIDELGRAKRAKEEKEEGAPLFEVTYTENLIFAHSYYDYSNEKICTCSLNFKSETGYPKAKCTVNTKIARGVKKVTPGNRNYFFHKFDEIKLREDGELHEDYKPGYTMLVRLYADEDDDESHTCKVIYTILKVRKFNKKRKSHEDPE